MKWSSSHLLCTVPLMVANGESGELIREFCGRLFSNRKSYLLRRDGAMEMSAPHARIPIIVRPLRDEDIAVVAKERPIRLAAMKSRLSTCYLATTTDGQICYMQWLIDSSQNDLIAGEFSGLCPPLKKDEMLLEWAYTFVRFRGLGLMADAMSQISEKGAAAGARWLYTYVAPNNIASLKGCRSAGYRPYQIRTERWRLFQRTESFEQLANGAKYSFEEQAAAV
jgi:hypothetical protein